MAFPKRIAVTVDENSDMPAADSLLAWKSVKEADEGEVAIYELVDEFEKKNVAKLKRKGTTRWFE